MAKLEDKEAKIVNKSKAKKRRHAETENEDEVVASKSLVIEKAPEPEENKDEPTTKTATKRKNKSAGKIKEKRLKKATEHEANNKDDDGAAVENNNKDSEHQAEDGLHEPTWAELEESEKPENTNAIVTVRQKKKQKHQQRQEAHKDQAVDKEKKRNEEYLQKWKDARSEWKFEKLRQISIQQHIFDEQKICESVWPIALEYLSGTKGAAKEKICKLAEGIIDELDEQCSEQPNEEQQQAIVESAKYQRARDLLQSFD